jgi:hypothetical protein
MVRLGLCVCHVKKDSKVLDNGSYKCVRQSKSRAMPSPTVSILLNTDIHQHHTVLAKSAIPFIVIKPTLS